MLFQSTSCLHGRPYQGFSRSGKLRAFQQWNLLVTKDEKAFYETGSFMLKTVFECVFFSVD